MIDNVRMREIDTNESFELPSAVTCYNNIIYDLKQYILPTQYQNGVFSGIGVVQNGDQFDFNPNGLSAGTYQITYSYQSPNLCFELTDEIDVIGTPMLLTAAPTHITCPCANNGAIDLTVIGGTPPYSYYWTDLSSNCASFVPVTTQDLSSITNGEYFVTVQDGLGCVQSMNVSINYNAPIPNFTTDLIISQTTPNWTGVNYLFNANLIISANANFIITASTLKFTESHGVIIEPGGKLTVQTNSILTNFCGNFWDGIRGKANGAVRSEFSIKTNSQIQYARIGYRNHSDDTFYGGKITCHTTTFKNNERDVELKSYTLSGTDYGGTFTKCTFLLNSSIISGANYKRRVNLARIGRTSFLTCDFVNTVGSLLNNGEHIAIRAFMASVQVIGCPTCSMQNKISGFTYGLYLEANSYTPPISAFSEFENMKFECHRGAYLMRCRGNQVLNCTFNNLPSLFNANPYIELLQEDNASGSFAIYELRCDGYQIAKNNINQSAANTRYGIVTNQSGGGTPWIYDNNLNFQKYGIAAWNTNRDASSGVQVQCNDFEGNFVDMWISDPGADDGAGASIAAVQGFFSTEFLQFVSAGNDFNGSSSSDNLDEIKRSTGISGAENFTYWYKDEEMVQSKSNADNQIAPLYNNCNQIFLMNPGDEATTANSSILLAPALIEQLVDTETSFATKENQLQALVDGGNTDELTEEVLFTTYANALATYELLMQNAGKLSEEVMIAAIKNEYNLPAVLLTQILSSNPTAARSPQIQAELDERMNPLSEYQREEILEAMELISQKEEIEWQMEFLRNNRNYAISQLYDLYINDPAVSDPATAITTLLNANKWSEDRYLLVEMHASQSHYASAIALLESFDQYFEVSETEQEELDNLVQLYTWQQTQSNGANLSSVVLDEVTMLTEHSSNKVSNLAFVILGIETNLSVPLYEDVDGEPRVDRLKSSKNKGKIYPNPTGNFATVHFSQNFPNGSIINICDITGKVVLSINRIDEQQDYYMNFSSLAVGSYSLQLLSAEGEYFEAILFYKQ